MGIKIQTSIADFQELHKIADSRGKTVRVPRKMLVNLLLDHSEMYGEVLADNLHVVRHVEKPVEDKPKKKKLIIKKRSQ